MDEEVNPNAEIVAIGADRYIALERDRRWPKYTVNWALRRRDGEQDFPIATGAAESLHASGESLEELWARLRDQALRQANEAAGAEAPAAVRRSLLSRLFGR
jgi:hypothetical protein